MISQGVSSLVGDLGVGGDKNNLSPIQSHSKWQQLLSTSCFEIHLPRGVMLCCRLVLMRLNYSHFHFFFLPPAPTSPSTPVTLCSEFLHIPSTLHFLFFNK